MREKQLLLSIFYFIVIFNIFLFTLFQTSEWQPPIISSSGLQIFHNQTVHINPMPFKKSSFAGFFKIQSGWKLSNFFWHSIPHLMSYIWNCPPSHQCQLHFLWLFLFYYFFLIFPPLVFFLGFFFRALGRNPSTSTPIAGLHDALF